MTERPTSVVRVSAGQVEYRLERRGDAAVIVFHGGHMRAGLALGEEVFADLGYTVLAPSRPGYGRTPVQTGVTPSGFADVTRELCSQLGIHDVAAVVGISGGGRTAVAMAARHPELARRLILESAVGSLPWPDRRLRRGARIAYNAVTEKATWRIVRALLSVAPTTMLLTFLRSLSTEPPDVVLASLTDQDRSFLLSLFSRMRSGHGFVNDLRAMPDLTADVRQPTLIIATRNDGAVPFAHAESLAAAIRGSELVVSDAESHVIWLSRDYPAIAERIRTFLGKSSPR